MNLDSKLSNISRRMMSAGRSAHYLSGLSDQYFSLSFAEQNPFKKVAYNLLGRCTGFIGDSLKVVANDYYYRREKLRFRAQVESEPQLDI